ncbi:unnamed protein product [Rhizophagus irregularis]|nr:unnamed protein product [Rhizophagus irregularis]
MSNKFESDVIKALEKILKTETEYNVIIQVGKEPDFKEFHAHSIILRFRSEYFNEILSAENIEKKDGKYIIKKQNITPQAFDVILKFLYTGHISINNKSGTELLDIMTSSDELKLKQLTKFTEDFIIENYQQFLQNDPVGILQIVNYNKSFVNLQEFCLEAICSDPKILFNSDKFIKLPAPLLEIVLKRDDLNLAEIEELRDDILKFHMASGYTPIFKISPRCHKFQFDSVIITNQIQDYSVLFANWIDKKEANNNKNINSAKSGYSSGTSSIGCYPQHGPIFGTNFYHVMDGTHWNIGNNNYINIGIPNKRIITDDYEVFQVMKK